jgi:hypothetical protein
MDNREVSIEYSSVAEKVIIVSDPSGGDVDVYRAQPEATAIEVAVAYIKNWIAGRDDDPDPTLFVLKEGPKCWGHKTWTYEIPGIITYKLTETILR